MSDPPPHEVRPCADPNDAGTSWRAEKLKDLVWRAKCLGVRDLPAVQALEREMRDATAVLDAMAVEQSAPEYARPWWKDGEYDEARAEAANDRGMEAYAARRFRDAHADFTEAARLEPRRAGYHANRAAASLKIGMSTPFSVISVGNVAWMAASLWASQRWCSTSFIVSPCTCLCIVSFCSPPCSVPHLFLVPMSPFQPHRRQP